MKRKLFWLFVEFLIYRTRASLSVRLTPVLASIPWRRSKPERDNGIIPVLAISGAVVALAALATVVISWITAKRAIYPKELALEDEEYTLAYYPFEPELITMEAADGVQTNAWWLPGSRNESVVVVHGYSTSPYSMLPNIDVLHRAGYNVIAPWLRSSPNGNAQPTTFGVTEQLDVMAAVDFARTQQPADQVAVVGTSMGAATAIIAGANDPDILAVAAEAPYKDVEGIVGHTFESFTHLPAYPFGPLAVFFGGLMLGIDVKHISPINDAARISPRPLLLIAGTEDQVIPYENSVEIFAGACEPRGLWIVPGAGHGRAIREDPEGYQQRVIEFLDSAFEGTSTVDSPA